MAATGGRLFRRGITKVFTVPTISSKTAPTATEINAGVDISKDINKMAGFTFDNKPIDVPDMSAAFVKKIPGEDQAADSVLTLYLEKTTNPLRATFAKGTALYIVIFSTGTAGASPAATDKCQVWPMTTTGFADEFDTGAVAALWHAGFTPNDTPALDVALV